MLAALIHFFKRHLVCVGRVQVIPCSGATSQLASLVQKEIFPIQSKILSSMDN